MARGKGRAPNRERRATPSKGKRKTYRGGFQY